MEAVSNWKKAHNKRNGQIIWKQSSLICKRERKHSSDPLIQTNKFIHNIFACLLSSLCLCFTQLMFLAISGGSFSISAPGLMELGALAKNGSKTLISQGEL